MLSHQTSSGLIVDRKAYILCIVEHMWHVGSILLRVCIKRLTLSWLMAESDLTGRHCISYNAMLWPLHMLPSQMGKVLLHLVLSTGSLMRQISCIIRLHGVSCWITMAINWFAHTGTPSLQESFHQSSSVGDSSMVRQAAMTASPPVRHRRVVQPLLGGVSVHPPAQQQPYYALQQPEMTMVSGPSAELDRGASSSLQLPDFGHGQAPSQHLQPLWEQQEVTLRMLELSVRSMSVPLAQVSLDLRGLLVEANMMMMGAAANNAVSAANNVNATLGNAIQQLRITVDTLKETVNDVCTIAHRDRVDLNSLYKAVANLDNLLGGAKMTATSVELTPLAYQLDDAAASIRANESGVEADQLAGRLVKAATSMLPHRQSWGHVAQQILLQVACCNTCSVCMCVAHCLPYFCQL